MSHNINLVIICCCCFVCVFFFNDDYYNDDCDDNGDGSSSSSSSISYKISKWKCPGGGELKCITLHNIEGCHLKRM